MKFSIYLVLAVLREESCSTLFLFQCHDQSHGIQSYKLRALILFKILRIGPWVTSLRQQVHFVKALPHRSHHSNLSCFGRTTLLSPQIPACGRPLFEKEITRYSCIG